MTSSSNRRARCKSCLLTLLGFSVPLALMALLLLGALSKELLELVLGRNGMETLSLYLASSLASCSHAAKWNAAGLTVVLAVIRRLPSLNCSTQ